LRADVAGSNEPFRTMKQYLLRTFRSVLSKSIKLKIVFDRENFLYRDDGKRDAKRGGEMGADQTGKSEQNANNRLPRWRPQEKWSGWTWANRSLQAEQSGIISATTLFIC
jgi:hypothetical protein